MRIKGAVDYVIPEKFFPPESAIRQMLRCNATGTPMQAVVRNYLDQQAIWVMARQDSGFGPRSRPSRLTIAAPPRILTTRDLRRSWTAVAPCMAMLFCFLAIILLMFLYHATQIEHVQIYVDDTLIFTEDPGEEGADEIAGPDLAGMF